MSALCKAKGRWAASRLVNMNMNWFVVDEDPLFLCFSALYHKMTTLLVFLDLALPGHVVGSNSSQRIERLKLQKSTSTF